MNLGSPTMNVMYKFDVLLASTHSILTANHEHWFIFNKFSGLLLNFYDLSLMSFKIYFFST